ncbi:MAG TPA: cytochrome c oxidase subunit 3, partial [Candidatus Saccharimonadales bacterium]|nr:cytochrome c oxidase subunit 3 [Candidatus Saccharimonadales bacterium]
RGRRDIVFAMLGITFLLGLGFLGMELHEFHHMVLDGNSWRKSAFLSSFFTLVGTHGAHITSGLIWLLAMVPKLARQGLTPVNVRRLTLFSLFWHFLDVIWIFIFTIVYMFGVIKP